MTIEPNCRANAYQLLAAEFSAYPVLVLSVLGRVEWANLAAQEWLDASLESLQRGPFAGHSPVASRLMELVQQAIEEKHILLVTQESFSGSERYDIHIKTGPQDGLAVVSVCGQKPSKPQDGHDSALGFGKMLAHELKNPLASARGAAQLIQRESDLSGAKELAGLVIEDVDRINRLADHWSQVGDIHLGNEKAVNLNQVAVEAVESVTRANSHQSPVIRQSYDPSLPALSGDADMLRQAVINLLQNAQEALGDEVGHVTIETRYDFDSGSRIGDVAVPLVLSVRDDGPGVPDSIRSGVFTPFVTTKPAGEGLGLAFAARIAKLHTGLLDYESQPGKTCFSLRLPISQRSPSI
jgi:two-component system nitrogen regulation sensor histidine kinase GlnL